MLTVKVVKDAKHSDLDARRFSTRIVEADEVDIHILRPGELVEVAGRSEGKSFAFYIAPRNKQPSPTEFAEGTDFWFQAFVENSAGATTEVIRF